MRLRKTPAAIAASVAAAALAIAGCSSSGSSSAGSTSSSAAPAQLTVWRMGPSAPSAGQLDEQRGRQFHKQYPRLRQDQGQGRLDPLGQPHHRLENAPSSGKNAPDITELGNTDTPTEASLGMLANIATNVNSWSEQVRRGLRHARQRHPGRQHLRGPMVRRRARHLVPQQRVPGRGHHLPARHLGAAAVRRQGADEEVPGQLRHRRAQQLHLRPSPASSGARAARSPCSRAASGSAS